MLLLEFKRTRQPSSGGLSICKSLYLEWASLKRLYDVSVIPCIPISAKTPPYQWDSPEYPPVKCHLHHLSQPGTPYPYSIFLHNTTPDQSHQIFMFLCLQLWKWKPHPWGLVHYASPVSLMSRTVPDMGQMFSKCLLSKWTNVFVLEMYVHPLLKRGAGPNIWSPYIIS